MSDQDRTPLDLPAVKERREAAFRQVFELGDGTATFTISIPSQETDSDALLRAALEDSVRLEAELTAVRNEAAELRAENEQLREALTHMLRVFRPREGEPGPDMYVETVAWTQAEAVLRGLAGNEEDEQ